MTNMNYIGLDVHKKTISYCVKDAAGQVLQEGKVGSTRRELDCWIKTLPQPRTIAMEATIFTGWIYDHLLPHAEKVKVAHPLMLRVIAAAKKKNDKIDAGKIADCLRCDFLPECHMVSTEIRDRRGRTLPVGQAGHQLLWAPQRGEKLRGQAGSHAHLQTKEQAHPAGSRGGCETSSSIQPRTGSGL
jgi:Transposase